MLNAYSARKTFTGSSRKARYAGTRLAINATRTSVAATAASVSGSDALTPVVELAGRYVKGSTVRARRTW